MFSSVSLLMRKFYFFTLVIVAGIFVSPIVFAQQELESSRDPLLVQKTFWLSEMNQKLPRELCVADSDFVRCYPVSEEQCQKHVREWSLGCLNQQNLPSKFSAVDEGEVAGEKAGRCLGEKFMALYGKKRKDIDECKFRRGEGEDE